MNELPLPSSLPQSITLLLYFSSILLVVIVFLLVIISSRLNRLHHTITRKERSKKTLEGDSLSPGVEVGSGTHFEEFLSEDASRKKLSKKEQFKAYRAWRTQKGLNWSK